MIDKCILFMLMTILFALWIMTLVAISKIIGGMI